MNSHRPIVGKLKSIWANAQRKLVELNGNTEYDIVRIVNEMIFDLGLHVEYPSTLPAFLSRCSMPTKVLSRMLSTIRYSRRVNPFYGLSDNVYYLEDLIYAHQNKIPMELVQREYVCLRDAFSSYEFYVAYNETLVHRRKLSHARLQGMYMMSNYASRRNIIIPSTARESYGPLTIVLTNDLSCADHPLNVIKSKVAFSSSIIIFRTNTHYRCVKNRFDYTPSDIKFPINELKEFLSRYRTRLSRDDIDVIAHQ